MKDPLCKRRASNEIQQLDLDIELCLMLLKLVVRNRFPRPTQSTHVTPAMENTKLLLVTSTSDYSKQATESGAGLLIGCYLASLFDMSTGEVVLLRTTIDYKYKLSLVIGGVQ